MTYALEGSIENKYIGTRYQIPSIYPLIIKNPMSNIENIMEPSPLNDRFLFLYNQQPNNKYNTFISNNKNNKYKTLY